MALCKKCGTEVNENEELCVDCQQETYTDDIEDSNEKVAVESDGANEEENEVNSEGDNENFVEVPVKKKGINKLTKWIIAAVLIVLVASGAAAYLLTAQKTNYLGNSFDNLMQGGIAAEQGNWIYYSSGTAMYKMKNDGSGNVKIYDGAVQNMSVVGNWIYFVNKDSVITKVDTNGKNLSKISENGKQAMMYGVTKEYVYYGTSDNASKIMRMKPDGSDKKSLTNLFVVISKDSKNTYGMSVVGTDASQKRTIDKIDSDGNIKEKLMDLDAAAINYNVVDGNIYYVKDSDGLYKYNLSNKSSSEVAKINMINPMVYNGYVYYLSVDSTAQTIKLLKVSLDGKDKKQIAEITSGNYNIAGNWIFYWDMNTGKCYKIKLDGTGKTEVK